MIVEEISLIEETLLSIIIRTEEWDKNLLKENIILTENDFTVPSNKELFNFISSNAENSIYGAKNLLISVKNNLSLRTSVSFSIKQALKIETKIIHLLYYAESVKKNNKVRELTTLLENFRGTMTVENIYTHINALVGSLEAMTDGDTTDKDKYELPDMDNIILDKMDRDAVDRGVIGMRMNKYKEMERILSGLRDGFTVVAGDPNVGKTKFITNLFWDVVNSNENSIGIYISLDDTRDDVLTNLIAIEAEGSLTQTDVLMTYSLDERKLKAYHDAADKVRELGRSKRYFIYDIETIDSFDMMIFHLNKIIKKYNRDYDKKKIFIMIDGAFNLDVSTKTSSSEIRVQNVARANLLKQVADKNHLPLVSTLELGKRKGEKYREPTYQDIMESGKYAYNAKLILLLCWNDFVEEVNNIINPKMKFSKNKFTGFKGSKHLKFIRDSGIILIDNSQQAKDNYNEKLNMGTTGGNSYSGNKAFI